jgi:hypothetical protein
MATAQSTMTGTQTGTQTSGGLTRDRDGAESLLKTMDESTKRSTGVSLFHILTIGSIGASIALFLSGKKEVGIFVGLWPPTFQALKAVVDKRDHA